MGFSGGCGTRAGGTRISAKCSGLRGEAQLPEHPLSSALLAVHELIWLSGGGAHRQITADTRPGVHLAQLARTTLAFPSQPAAARAVCALTWLTRVLPSQNARSSPRRWRRMACLSCLGRCRPIARAVCLGYERTSFAPRASQRARVSVGRRGQLVGGRWSLRAIGAAASSGVGRSSILLRHRTL